MDHHCQIANKCIGLFNKRLYLLFITTLQLLAVTNLVGLLVGNEMNEIVWLGVLVNLLTIAYITSILVPAFRIATKNMQ